MHTCWYVLSKTLGSVEYGIPYCNDGDYLILCNMYDDYEYDDDDDDDDNKNNYYILYFIILII